jgi:hypothetical protein
LLEENQLLPCNQIEQQLVQLLGDCKALINHSLAFLLESTPVNMPQSLLLEQQQHLQLHLLLPSVLLQWVVDKPSSDSNYTACCKHAVRAAQASATLYPAVLQDGPTSLYQHITGHSRPQPPRPLGLPPGLQPKVVVAIPHDIHATQLQLLGQLLPSLLQLWRNKTSDQPMPTSSPDGSSSSSSSSSGSSSSSSNSASPADSANPDSDLMKAVNSASHWAVQMSIHPPASSPRCQAGTSGSGGVDAFHSKTASRAAGMLCTLLEDVSRMELTAEQQAAAGMATRGNPSQSDAGAAPEGFLARHGLYMCLTPIAHNFRVGSLADPILMNHSPGSKPCMQLHSLLFTPLKCSAWDRALAPADSMLACKADGTLTTVFMSARAVIETATDKVAACQKPAITGALDSSSTHGSGSNPSSQEVTALLPWLALLGRCCLQRSCQLQAAGCYHLPAVSPVCCHR